jgi:periplasmic divalent cation tolerance protein
MKAADVVVVLVTVADEQEGAALATALVEAKLAACGNVVGPIRSIYRWEDAVQDASEYLLLLKARRADLAALERRVGELHSYDVPEVLALPVIGGSAAYLAWVGEVTSR